MVAYCLCVTLCLGKGGGILSLCNTVLKQSGGILSMCNIVLGQGWWHIVYV